MRRILTLLALSLCLCASADNSRLVNLFLGTAGDHGQVSPAAQLPYGLASVGPDSKVPSHVGYDYDVPEISGVSVTRVSGVGGRGAGGNLRILPALPDTPVSIVKKSEKAVPGYYQARLDNGVGMRLTATLHCAIENYSFSGNSERVLFVDFDSAIDHRRNECHFRIVSDNTISGRVKSSTVCNAGTYTLFFQLVTSEPFRVETFDDKTALLRFDPSVKEVEVRIGLSPSGDNKAGEELESISAKSFKTLRKEAAAAWKSVLSKVSVKGSTREQRVLFYTSMYRLFLSPFHATTPDGFFRTADGVPRVAEGWTFYSEWSMWDTYRTKFPMLFLLDPENSLDFCRSLVALYQTGKRNWATFNEPVPTVRTEHTQIALLDAWVKGIRDFGFEAAFPGMVAEDKEGSEPGATNGLTRNSPDQKMETIYDLWAMSRIATIIGDKVSALEYKTKSEEMFEETWKNEFMDITDDFALMKDNGLYQGTRWQYRWAVPVYADKMSEWVGKDVLASQLEEFFARHLFNQGNEPDIQTPFMLNLFGRPELTDSLVHALLTDDTMVHIYGGNAEYPEPFVGRAFQDKPDGYAPEMDEDDGAMSAWYMFAQMGFYPVCVGTDKYEMFTPLFKKVTLHLKDNDVTILRRCAPASSKRVVVDGMPLDGFTITHGQLTHADKIVFE